jgi:PST family polysaccharide transporter
MLVLMPIIFIGCAVLWIIAEPFCVFVLGEEYAPSAEILRVFIPVIFITLPTYIFGFPMLSPMGLTKYANYSIFAGTGFHIVGLVILFVTSNISSVNLATLTLITECIILTFRIIVVAKNRHVFNSFSQAEKKTETD